MLVPYLHWLPVSGSIKSNPLGLAFIPCFSQKYLLPLIMGGREDRKQLERMEASLSELSGSVAQTGKD